MKHDGKVVISTLLDNSGLKKGIGSVSGSLGGLKTVLGKMTGLIATAFSVTAIVRFGAESSKAAMELSNALQGLQSIVEGQGRSFSKAKSFLDEYVKDGLIPMANAAAAYKNLAARGYDDSQIQQTLIALKDASAFGRQASYSMGEAVQTATEGLKNENSILVDNAGVTKNVAKMWDDYAKSIGTTAAKLTQQQKIQAEVTGILEESKFQTGDAAKVAGTLSGQLQQLSFNFNNLKVAVGNAINPIVQSLLPVINSAVNALTRFANSIASVVGAIFGKVSVQTKAIAEGASAGAEAEKELADGIGAAGKAAKKAIAGFDELNVLQSNTGSGSGSSAGGGSSTTNSLITAEATVEDHISPKMQAFVDKIKELLEPLKKIDLTPAKEAFTNLGDALSDFGKTISEKLEWAWFNILAPLAKWTIEKGTPAVLDLLGASLRVLGGVIEDIWPFLEALWDYFLEPLANFTGDVILGFLDGLTGYLNHLADTFHYTAEDAYILSAAEKELAESAQKTADGFRAIQDATIKEEEAISGEIERINNLVTELDKLVSVNGRVQEADKSRVEYILGELNKALGAEYTMVDNVIDNYQDLHKEIKKVIASKKANLLLEAHEDDYLAALQAKEEAWDNLNLKLEEFNAQKAQYNKKMEEELADPHHGLFGGLSTTEILDKELELLKKKGNAYFEAEKSYKEYINTINGYDEAHQLILEENYDAAIEILLGKNTAYSEHADVVESESERAVKALEEELADAKRIADQTKFCFEEGMAGFTQGMVDETAQTVLDIEAELERLVFESADIGGSVGEEYATGIEQSTPQAETAANNLSDAALLAIEGTKNDFKEAGEDSAEEFGRGLTGAFESIVKSAKKIIQRSLSGGAVASAVLADISSATANTASYSLKTPAIPQLAKGSVLPPNKPFLAMVGDQRHGTNVEAPLSTIQEAVAAVMQEFMTSNMAGHEATVAVLRELLEAVLGITIGDDVIANAVDRYNRKMAVVRGG